MAGRNERGGLFSSEVHAAHAVSAFQTKLSTASSVTLQLIICDRLCYWLYMILWCGWRWKLVGYDVSSLTRLFLYTKRFSRRWLDRLHCLGWRIQSGEPYCFLYVCVAPWPQQQQQWSVVGRVRVIVCYTRRTRSLFCPALDSLFFSRPDHTALSPMFSTPLSPRSQLYTWRPSIDCHRKPRARSPLTSGSRDLIAIDNDIIRKCAESFSKTVLLFSTSSAWYRNICHSR